MDKPTVNLMPDPPCGMCGHLWSVHDHRVMGPQPCTRGASPCECRDYKHPLSVAAARSHAADDPYQAGLREGLRQAAARAREDAKQFQPNGAAWAVLMTLANDLDTLTPPAGAAP